MSTGSRSPSPLDSMQVDDHDVYKYDEYTSGYEKEVVTVNTKIPSSNKGFGMLMKLGWVEGQGLGVSGDGEFRKIWFGRRAVSPLNLRTCRPHSIPCEARYDRSGEVRPGRRDDRDHSLTASRAGF